MPGKISSAAALATDDIHDHVIEIINNYKHLEGPLLPILHAVQADYGYVPPQCLSVIAHGLNISRAEVHGVVSFYHDFRSSPAGRHRIKLCRAEACQAMGGDQLAMVAKQLFGLDWHQTSASGAVTLEPVYCLGLCACAPAAMVDDRLIGRLDEAGLQALAAELS